MIEICEKCDASSILNDDNLCDGCEQTKAELQYERDQAREMESLAD